MEKYEIRGEVSTIRFTQKNSATPGGTRKGEEKGGEGGEEGEEGEEGEGEEKPHKKCAGRRIGDWNFIQFPCQAGSGCHPHDPRKCGL